MEKLTRREFLKLAATGAGALLVGRLISGCSPDESIPAGGGEIPTQAPSSANNPPQSAPAAAPAKSLPAGAPHLVVARQGQPEELVRRALEPFGGLQSFVHSGANVIIKPNICVGSHGPEYAATTNPWVVAALVKMCFESGARSVRVMDFPFGSSAEQAYRVSGIEDQVLAAGGEMVIMSHIKFAATNIPQGTALKKSKIYEDVLKADVLINVPIAKDHGMSRLTLGMKNLMGTILNREALHFDLGQCLADLSTIVRPTLTVIDAVRILTANGPTGGNLDDVRQLDTVIVSPDIVAADSYAATLFGLRPLDLAYVDAATRMGLGRSDLENLKIEELVVAG